MTATTSWCESEFLLASIYSFKHYEVGANQQESRALQYAGMIQKFVTDTVCDDPERCRPPACADNIDNIDFTAGDRAALTTATTLLASEKHKTVAYYPAYASSVIFLPDLPGSLALLVVGLDDWEFACQRLKVSEGPEHVAVCRGASVLAAGSIPKGHREACGRRISQILAAAQSVTGDARSAASGDKIGHQKTPAFMLSVAKAAAASSSGGGGGDECKGGANLSSLTAPKGGFTDVGLHTGGKARDTCWPLVRETLKALLCSLPALEPATQPESLHQLAMTNFHLWLLRRQVAALVSSDADDFFLSEAKAHQDVLTGTMQILETAAVHGADLAKSGRHSAAVERALTQCESARQQLAAAASRREMLRATRYSFPAADEVIGQTKQYRNPRIRLVPPSIATQQTGSLEEARARVNRNLFALPVLPRFPHCSIATASQAIKNWAEWDAMTGKVAGQLALRSIEDEIFRRATRGIKHPDNALTVADMQHLTHLVDDYRGKMAAVVKCITADKAAPLLLVEMQSREMLLVWVCFCLVHVSASAQEDILCRRLTGRLRYGVALRPGDLQHLTLSDKISTDAALEVARYLTESRGVAEIFSLRDAGKATFQMATEYASEDPHMARQLKLEQHDAQTRVQGHWEAVQRKQKLAQKLRGEISTAEAQVEYYRGIRDSCRYRSSAYRSASSSVTSFQRQLSQLQQQLQIATKSPTPVIQPLPANADIALRNLFFIHMPSTFRSLARLSFLGQQLLLPHPQRLHSKEQQQLLEEVTVPGIMSRLCGHHRTYRNSGPYLSSPTAAQGLAEGSLWLGTTGRAPRQSDVGSSHVDNLHSPSDGVWYPDTLNPALCWQGSSHPVDGCWSSTVFNPFVNLSHKLIVDTFTEKLTGSMKDLQWTMPQYGQQTHNSRGNMGLARQEDQPRWLSKPGFLDFCSLRSYPALQLRKLCGLLKERTVPFANVAVHALIFQAVEHLGELTEGDQPALLWRSEWEELLPALTAELAQLADDLSECPREWESIGMLGELADIFSAWHPVCRETARKFANIGFRWADNMKSDEADDSVATRDKQARRSLLLMTALSCHVRGELSVDDVTKIVTRTTQIWHGTVLEQGAPQVARQRAMAWKSCNVAARRHQDLLQVLDSHTEILTSAVRQVLERAPTVLPWVQLRHESSGQHLAAYEALGSDGFLYSLNIMDGTVLLNGCPPGRLPKDILSHKLYKRTFGNWDFEVSGNLAIGSGVLSTTRPHDNRYHYDFSLDSSGGLSVLEIDQDLNTTLELLPPGLEAESFSWGKELPTRLLALCSHWINRERDIILFRPMEFNLRQVFFLVSVRWDDAEASSTPGSSGTWGTTQCARVPAHLQNSSWLRNLLPDINGTGPDCQVTDLLVLHKSEVKTVLHKFETQNLIHTFARHIRHQAKPIPWQDGQARLVFELPRYQLEFLVASDGSLQSLQHSGFHLARCQQLVWEPQAGRDSRGSASFTLPAFSQYLVLEPNRARESKSAGCANVVLIPQGAIHRASGSPAVTAEVGNTFTSSCEANLRVHTYDVHPRFHTLQARSILPRLQLAALYAATATLLPEPATQQTGAQTAMELVRQSWTNRPLTRLETQQLIAVAELGGYLAAALPLIVHELRASAAQLNFLPFPGTEPNATPLLLPDLVTAYLAECKDKRRGGSVNPRLRLHRQEARRLQMGAMSCSPEAPPWLVMRQYEAITSLPQCPVSNEVVSRMELEVCELAKVGFSPELGCNQKADKVHCPYPLMVRSNAPPIEDEMHNDLKESWDALHASDTGIILELDVSEATATAHRVELETYLEEHLSSISTTTGCYGSAHRMMRAAALLPLLGCQDMVRCSFDLQTIHHMNPFLDSGATRRLQATSRLWLQLCVLEDRLLRITGLCCPGSGGSSTALLKELSVHRTWQVDEHPLWLVFEAEGQLQIRPKQHYVAQQLMANLSTGPIVQLNMGEGKTRVILPMLVLAWANRHNLVRLNFLSSLLDEGYSHLHRHLTASILNRKLFAMPFNRDVKIEPARLANMQSVLTYCKKEGGMLVTTPESRLSMLLKAKELWMAKAREDTVEGLEAIAQAECMDILDESDQLLHHRFQLIYAHGDRRGLPTGQERQDAVQAILRIISHHAHSTDNDIGPALAVHGISTWAKPEHAGSFCGLRLLPGESLASSLPLEPLVNQLFIEAPYEMRWLKDSANKGTISKVILDTSVEAKTEHIPDLTDMQRAHVLALRGLMGCGLMSHSLSKRHEVDYGINRGKSAKKRLAVPFRAAHTPAERSEFSHPDVALIFTNLAYYYDGLSKEEFHDAVTELLHTGTNQQHRVYTTWLKLSWQDIPTDVRSSLDDVRKIDPSNGHFMAVLWHYFSHNMEVVNWWLNTCVFPKEAQQYPQRFSTSSWNVADNCSGTVVGFSGTNDNHRLLPLQVHQRHLEEEELKATNGKMLSIILQNPTYSSLDIREDYPAWRAVLDKALNDKLDAIIDCGALLAGVSMIDAVRYLLRHLEKGRFSGVCFHDDAKREWIISDVQHRHLPRHASPVRERQCITVFDDAHCRGADLQLRPDAIGLVTLGPGITKDKLMQAAGRLRQLGRGGQGLRFAGSSDVTRMARLASGLPGGSHVTSRHIMQWVMDNTVQSTLHGVLQWCSQGLHFAINDQRPERALQEELLQLEDMYCGSQAQEEASRLGQKLVTQAKLRCQANAHTGGTLAPLDCTPRAAGMMTVIADRAGKYGAGYYVTARSSGMLDEECERELQQEEEQEQEEEIEVPAVEPAHEEDWVSDAVLTAASPAALPGSAGLMTLSQAAQSLSHQSIASMPWSEQVHCTRNFLRSTKDSMARHETKMDDYLRQVDNLLVFPGPLPSLVMVSEREANALLMLLPAESLNRSSSWLDRMRLRTEKRTSRPPWQLLSRQYLWEAQLRPSLPTAPHAPLTPALAGRDIPKQQSAELLRAMVSVQLFNGEATYSSATQDWESDVSTSKQGQHLRRLVRHQGAAVLELVRMRGKMALFSHSHLQQACD